MPNLDGTGPQGQGPLTGRGMGNCDGANAAGRPRFGRGAGLGNGRGQRRFLGRFGRGNRRQDM